MNRPVMNLLGGSVSLAAIILVANPAHAFIPPDVKGDSGAGVDAQVANPFLSQEAAPQPAQIQATDTRIKQLAQATFGCTCTNCMNTVRQMVQQGQLSL